MAITIGPEVLRDFDRSSRLEWLETNGLGGWAMSTVAGTHSRRYHGLLVAATRPPVERMVLLSRLDETVHVENRSVELASVQFPGAIGGRGHQRLVSFARDLFPVFEYDLAQVAGAEAGDDAARVRLRKTVAAIAGENTTVVLYEMVVGPSGRAPDAAALEVELRPFFAVRGYHELRFADRPFRREAEMTNDVLTYRAWDGAPEVHLRVAGARFAAAPDWWHRFELQEELDRGFDGHEDLFTPGALRSKLEPGRPLGAVISTAPVEGRDAVSLLEDERRRRERLLARSGSTSTPAAPRSAEGRRLVPAAGSAEGRKPARSGAGDDGSATLIRALSLAADQFLVRRGERDTTVIAGYPWFTDWGRDTMIALPGLCLVTGRHQEAQGILRAFAAAVDRGMLPNRFPDGAEAPEYNTIDATLWFFVAIWRYLEATGDEAFVARELVPVLEDILAWHRRGTRHGIHEDADGLLYGGEAGVQLTWMDARVGDWVVTPRRGKPVEIQALWCNALRILADLRQRQGRAADAVALRADAERAGRRFVELFWNPGAGCLHDCIDQRGGAPPIEVDDRIRPNQILALSLPFELLTPEQAASVLGVVESKLLTRVGLRSLAPDHPDYGARYEGGPAERDSLYHQGPVWSWLLGPYITALVRVRGDAGRVEARRLLDGATAHLAEGCVGSVSEIFDGDPPHRPRGCPAQAWGVSEWLRAALEEAAMGEAEPGPGRRAAMCEEELRRPDDVAVLAAEDNRQKRKAAAASFTPDPLAPPRRPGA